MKRHLNTNALTLIEIIIAIAIFGIIMISSLTIFSKSYIDIINSGSRSNAVEKANTVIEKMREQSTIDETTLQTVLNSLGSDYSFEPAIDLNDLPIRSTSEENLRYLYNAGITLNNVEGDLITISVFYQNGVRNVTLTSFFAKPN